MAKDKEDKREITIGTLETFAEHLKWDPEKLEATQKAIRQTWEVFIPKDQRGQK